MEKAITPVIEHHPWGFFLPENTHLLMLGSFPPPRIRWSMDFYYPNIQNDMWRILGLLFYADKDYFLATPKNFSEEKCRAFCNQIGLGLGDTGMEVIRQKGNASDKFLEVIKPMNSSMPSPCSNRTKSHGHSIGCYSGTHIPKRTRSR